MSMATGSTTSSSGPLWAMMVGVIAGEAYIIYGKAGTDGMQFGEAIKGRQVLDTSILAPADGFILQGDAPNDWFGISSAGAGDINGDGLDDFIVGAWWGDDGGDLAGEAYIIYGKAGTDGAQFGTEVKGRQVLDTTGLAPTDGFIFQGDERDDFFGRSVSGAGDVNSDGFDDLIAGAYGGDDGGNFAGEAYVVYGGTHLGEVVAHDQTLAGEAGEPLLLGGAGNDVLVGHAATEVLYGGAGDDELVLADTSFRRIDGGLGDDTLVLGESMTLDMTDAAGRGRIRDIEVISLSDTTAEVKLNQATVYALSDTYELATSGRIGTSTGHVLLRLEGVAGAMVELEGGTWTTMTTADGEPDIYTLGSARLWIDDGLVVA